MGVPIPVTCPWQAVGRTQEVRGMGINNRQRRADKKRRSRSGPTNSRPRPVEDTSDGDHTLLAESLCLSAADMAADGDSQRVARAVDALVALPRHASSGGTTAGWVLSGCLDKAVRAAWSGGWQPLDLVRAATKRLGGGHAGLAITAIASEARTSAGPGAAVPERWRAQLSTVGVAVWWDANRRNYVEHWADRERLDPTTACTIGVELLAMLHHLPVLPCLMPPPAQWGAATGRTATATRSVGVDGRVLAKVRALLAKAESTTFDEEADALTAKAQELMARYAIDQAMLHHGDPDEAPIGLRTAIDDPYAGAKAHLLGVVASANRCRTVWFDSYGFCTIFGFSVDIDIVEVLYTSLLVQATRAMTAAGSVRDSAGRSRTRSFRQSFLVAFARRIDERLQNATGTAAAEAGEVHGGDLLPVLAGRCAAVDDALADAFPQLVSRNLSVTNYAGWVAGRVAADMAVLGPEQELLPAVKV